MQINISFNCEFSIDKGRAKSTALLVYLDHRRLAFTKSVGVLYRGL